MTRHKTFWKLIALFVAESFLFATLGSDLALASPPSGRRTFLLRPTDTRTALDGAIKNIKKDLGLIEEKVIAQDGADKIQDIVRRNTQKIFSKEFDDVQREETKGEQAGPGRKAVNGTINPEGVILKFGNYQDLPSSLQKKIAQGEAFEFGILFKVSRQVEGPVYDFYLRDKEKTPKNVVKILEQTVQESNRIEEFMEKILETLLPATDFDELGVQEYEVLRETLRFLIRPALYRGSLEGFTEASYHKALDDVEKFLPRLTEKHLWRVLYVLLYVQAGYSLETGESYYPESVRQRVFPLTQEAVKRFPPPPISPPETPLTKEQHENLKQLPIRLRIFMDTHYTGFLLGVMTEPSLLDSPENWKSYLRLVTEFRVGVGLGLRDDRVRGKGVGRDIDRLQERYGKDMGYYVSVLSEDIDALGEERDPEEREALNRHRQQRAEVILNRLEKLLAKLEGGEKDDTSTSKDGGRKGGDESEWPELVYHRHILETGDLKSKLAALEAITKGLTSHPSVPREEILEVILKEYHSAKNKSLKAYTFQAMTQLGTHVPRIRNEVLKILVSRQTPKYIVSKGLLGLSLSDNPMDSEMVEKLKGFLFHPDADIAQDALRALHRLLRRRKIEAELLRQDTQWVKRLSQLQYSRSSQMQSLSTYLLSELGLPFNRKIYFLSEARSLHRLLYGKGVFYSQLSMKDMKKLYDLITREGMSPQEFLVDRYKEGRQVVFLGYQYHEEFLPKLGEVVLKLKEEVDLTHVALPFPSAKKDLLQKVIRGEVPPTDWEYTITDVGVMDDPEKQEATVRFLQQLHGQVRFILYEPYEEEETKKSVKGELFLEERIRAIQEVIHQNPHARILLLGNPTHAAKEDQVNLDGSIWLSLAAEMGKQLGMKKVFSVIVGDKDLWKFEQKGGAHNLSDFIDLFPLATSFGLHILGTPLAPLHYDEYAKNTFGSAWDGLIFLKSGGENPSFFIMPEEPAPEKVRPTVPYAPTPVPDPSWKSLTPFVLMGLLFFPNLSLAASGVDTSWLKVDTSWSRPGSLISLPADKTYVAPSPEFPTSIPTSVQKPPTTLTAQQAKQIILGDMRELVKSLEEEVPEHKASLTRLINTFEKTELTQSLSLTGAAFMATRSGVDGKGQSTLEVFVNPHEWIAMMEEANAHPHLKTFAKGFLLKESGSLDEAILGSHYHNKFIEKVGAYQAKVQSGADHHDPKLKRLVRELFGSWIASEYTGEVRMYTYFLKKGLGPYLLEQLAYSIQSDLTRLRLLGAARTFREILKEGKIDEKRTKIAFAVTAYNSMEHEALAGIYDEWTRQVWNVELSEGNITLDQLDRLKKHQMGVEQVAKPGQFFKFLTDPSYDWIPRSARTDSVKDGGFGKTATAFFLTNALLWSPLLSEKIYTEIPQVAQPTERERPPKVQGEPLHKTKQKILAYFKGLIKELKKEEPKRKESLDSLLHVFERTGHIESLSFPNPMIMGVFVDRDSLGNPVKSVRVNPNVFVPLMEESHKDPKLRIFAKSLLLKETGSYDGAMVSFKEDAKRRAKYELYLSKAQAGLDSRDPDFRRLAREIFREWIEVEYLGDVRMYGYLLKKGVGPETLNKLADLFKPGFLRSGLRSESKNLGIILKDGKMDERRTKIRFAIGLFDVAKRGILELLRTRLINDVFVAEVWEGNVTPEELERLRKKEMDIDQVTNPKNFLKFLTDPGDDRSPQKKDRDGSKDGGEKARLVEKAEEIREALVKKAGGEEQYQTRLDLTKLDNVFEQLKDKTQLGDNLELLMLANLILRQWVRAENAKRIAKGQEPVTSHDQDILPKGVPSGLVRGQVIMISKSLMTLPIHEGAAFLKDARSQGLYFLPTEDANLQEYFKDSTLPPQVIVSKLLKEGTGGERLKFVFFVDADDYTKWTEGASGSIHRRFHREGEVADSVFIKVTRSDPYAMLKIGQSLFALSGEKTLDPQALGAADKFLLQTLTDAIQEFPQLPDLTGEMNYITPILIEILEHQV